VRHTIRLALDRSVRNYDSAGRLRVASAVLTRACVSPYMGGEIPGYDEIGLTPSRTYMLLRPANELLRALDGFNGLPILTEHVPVSADDHRGELVVGSTGSSARLADFELTNSLTIWAAEGIDLIESGEARSLSCGYGYTPVLRSGTFQGAPYDLVMTDIKPNHLALVPEPRVAGAMVGDSNPFTKGTDMDADTCARVLEFLRDKLDPDDLVSVESLMSDDPATAMDDPPPFPGRPRVGGGMDPIRQGMDRNVVRQIQAIREAEEHVRPYAGQVLGMDSVAAVYGRALKAIGYTEASAVRDPKALKILFDSVKLRQQSSSAGRSHGVSAANVKSFRELFPGAVPLKSVI
jgi:hypothetical protein